MRSPNFTNGPVGNGKRLDPSAPQRKESAILSPRHLRH